MKFFILIIFLPAFQQNCFNLNTRLTLKEQKDKKDRYSQLYRITLHFNRLWVSFNSYRAVVMMQVFFFSPSNYRPTFCSLPREFNDIQWRIYIFYFSRMYSAHSFFTLAIWMQFSAQGESQWPILSRKLKITLASYIFSF